MTIRKSDFLTPAPPHYHWPRCPDADGFVRECLRRFLQSHRFAARLARQFQEKTSTEFISWTDHIILPKGKFNVSDLSKHYGFVIEPNVKGATGDVFLYHPYADLPRIIISSKEKNISCAIHVDQISDFQLAHDLSYPVEGEALSSFRILNIPEGKRSFKVIERRGTRNYSPKSKLLAKDYLWGVETWVNRKRNFEDEKKGTIATWELAKRIVKRLGSAVGSSAFLEAERMYWQKKNRAAKIQYARQQKLGLGWANHDHHTFRSSRSNFSTLIKTLMTFGFKKRERYHAGEESGWGAQIMEQPVAGLVIFADVDLTPKEVSIDFSSKALSNLKKPGTVGLWCALHGDSLLQAGMHHLEAQFDFDHLRASLSQNNVSTMPPFSDFPYLRQAFTKGEMWPVSPDKLEKLQKAGKISQEAVGEIMIKGAVGSHLENLQRREGFKGFNQRGVSDIIRDVNPEKQALRRD